MLVEEVMHLRLLGVVEVTGAGHGMIDQIVGKVRSVAAHGPTVSADPQHGTGKGRAVEAPTEVIDLEPVPVIKVILTVDGRNVSDRATSTAVRRTCVLQGRRVILTQFIV